jgi:hypothetical protein
VSPASVSGVEPLGIVAVQNLHPVGEIGPRCIDYEVVVVRHQAERLAGPVVALDDEREQAEEVPPVVVVVVDRHLRDPARSDVKEPVRQARSGNPRHR